MGKCVGGRERQRENGGHGLSHGKGKAGKKIATEPVRKSRRVMVCVQRKRIDMATPTIKLPLMRVPLEVLVNLSPVAHRIRCT